MGKANRWFGRIALLMISLLLTFGALETGIRLTGYDPNESEEWRFDPDLGWTLDPQFSKADSMNPSGFRHCPAEFEKPSNTKRLLIVGDSFTAAPDFPYQATYPGLLESWLNERDPSNLWQVISLAVNDWGSAQELIALKEIGLKYDPGAIVVQSFPFNDFCNNSRILAYSCSLQDAHRPYFELRNGVLEVTYMEPLRSRFRNTSRLFGLLENRLDPQMGRLPADWERAGENADDQRRAFFRYRAAQAGLEHEGAVWALIPDALQPEPIRESWKVTEAIFAEMVELAKGQQIPLIPLVIPFSKTLDQDWESIKSVLDAPMEPTYGTDRFEEAFRRLGEEPISLRKVIEAGRMKPGDYFISPQDGHLGPFGHSECAAQILAAMTRRGLLSASPASTALESVDLNAAEIPFGVVMKGITQLFSEDSARWRYGRGESSSMAFWIEAPSNMTLTARLKSGVPDLVITVSLDNSELLRSGSLASGREWAFNETFPAGAGRHELRFDYHSASQAEPLKSNSCRINGLTILITADSKPADEGTPQADTSLG